MKMLCMTCLVAALLTACGDGGSAGVGNRATPAEEQDLASRPLSQELICAAVASYYEHADLDGLRGVSVGNLKGDALRDFKAWQRGIEADYPSEAYELPVPFRGKTYWFLLVTENNDGGGSVGVYRKDGRVVATHSYGESSPIRWSKPADSCPDP